MFSESDRITKNIEDITVKLVQTSQKEEVEAILEQFTGILTDAGSDHIREVNINKGGKGNIILGAKWYDKECREQRGKFIEYEKRYYQTFEDGDRVLMCEQRNIFRSLCREKKREYNQKEADRLVYLSKKDPKNFWREFKGNKDRVVDQECNFFEHFKQLANIDSRVGEEGTKEVENENRGDNNNKSETLDSQIKLEELESALKGLKKNKSAGEDNLLNEFFKNASLPVKLFILLLFNKILDMEFFPAIWAIGKVVPVFKKGDKRDANNYRGITIMSCLGKLFTKIMNDRLNRFVEEKDILSDVQYGFRKGRGTTDCLFILKGLIDIMFSKGLKLYVCFVDYEKAYDLIDRTCLFHKLIKEGLSSKCINVFKSMYSKVKLKVSTDNENRLFSSNVGLLQGESTSPLLFSLFVNDLESSLFNTDINLNIVDTLIKILMFADDMIILSTSIEGLQEGLNSLSDYCKKWGLTVNINKTKIVIFRRGGKIAKQEKWVYNGKIVEIVSSFKYVGCELTSSGSFSNCIKNLVQSARRALFSMKRNLNKNIEILPETQLDMFNLMIAPILNYGCEVWGLRVADPIEKFHLSFLKCLLDVKISTPNCFVYGEVGVFPLIVERKVRIIKYWLKVIKNLNVKEHLVQKVYRELVNINTENPEHENWVSGVKSLLESTGFGYIWQQQYVINETIFLNSFKQRLKDIYMQNWWADIQTTTDNRLFKHIKTSFLFEPYLRINNRALRSSLTKIRLSSHTFLCERGRWGPNNIEIDQRRCTVCNKIENEFHCLIECPKFNNERRGLVTNDLLLNPNFNNFVKYFTANDFKTQRKLALLCFKVHKEYKELLMS